VNCRHNLLLRRQRKVAVCAGVFEVPRWQRSSQLFPPKRQFHQTILHQVDSGQGVLSTPIRWVQNGGAKNRFTDNQTPFQTNQIPPQMWRWRHWMPNFRDRGGRLATATSSFQQSHLCRLSTSIRTTLETWVRRPFWPPLNFWRVSCHHPLKSTSARTACVDAWMIWILIRNQSLTLFTFCTAS